MARAAGMVKCGDMRDGSSVKKELLQGCRGGAGEEKGGGQVRPGVGMSHAEEVYSGMALVPVQGYGSSDCTGLWI